jgi:hypothetical protein
MAQVWEYWQKFNVHIFEVSNEAARVVFVVVVFLHGEYCTDYNFKFMLYTEQSLYEGDHVLNVLKVAIKIILSYNVKLWKYLIDSSTIKCIPYFYYILGHRLKAA